MGIVRVSSCTLKVFCLCLNSFQSLSKKTFINILISLIETLSTKLKLGVFSQILSKYLNCSYLSKKILSKSLE